MKQTISGFTHPFAVGHRSHCLLLLLVMCCCQQVLGAEYDLVIANGRVMDPESGLDGVRNIGITEGKIEAISEVSLDGEEEIDATGLVVAPGFIDLHAHGQDPLSRSFQAADGVTTALELEIGVLPVSDWLEYRHGWTTSPERGL